MTQEKVTYDQEFKDNAAKYCIEKASSITQGAKDLGINKCSIPRWVNEYKEKTGLMEKEKVVKQERDQKQNQEKDKQLKLMIKRILELEGQVDLLKKVIGMFSENPQKNIT